MALRGALKDRARIVRKEADAKRVQGRTIFHDRASPLFRCRLDIQEAPEGKDQAGNMSTTETPMLMTDRVDADRNLLFIQADDELELESRDLAHTEERGWHLVAVYQVSGEPKPIRKKRKVIGWQMTLKLVSESPVDPSRTA